MFIVLIGIGYSTIVLYAFIKSIYFVTVYLEASHRDVMNENNKDEEKRKTRKV